MTIRTIMIFPEFTNIELINQLRVKYDPLFNKVRPHITLVFPFESQLTTEDIKNYLKKALCKFNPFQMELQGISRDGLYLFLNVTKGRESIKEMHDSLFNEFSCYKPNWLKVFHPHLTLGHFKTENEAENAYNDSKTFDFKFRTDVYKISVEIIGENKESIIETEYILNNNEDDIVKKS